MCLFNFYNILFFQRKYVPEPANKNAIMKTMTNPYSLSAKGTGTFIPQKLESIVGIARIIVTDAKNRITKLRLLEIIEANTSNIPVNICVYISTISIA